MVITAPAPPAPARPEAVQTSDARHQTGARREISRQNPGPPPVIMIADYVTRPEHWAATPLPSHCGSDINWGLIIPLLFSSLTTFEQSLTNVRLPTSRRLSALQLSGKNLLLLNSMLGFQTDTYFQRDVDIHKDERWSVDKYALAQPHTNSAHSIKHRTRHFL